MHFLITAKYAVANGAAARRVDVQAEHVQGILSLASEGVVLDGGLLLDEQGSPTGSVLISQFADHAVLDAYLAQEPYVREQVWEDVTVLAFHRLDAQSLQAWRFAPGPVKHGQSGSGNTRCAD